MIAAAPPRLETARTVLRRATEADAASIAAFQRDNREHFRPWDPRRPESFFTTAFWTDRIAKDRDNAEADRGYRYFLFDPDTGVAIGFVHLSNVVRGAFQSCHVGFGLDQERVGAGLMHEALERILALAFGALRLHRVEANHRPENVRSGHLLKRLEFVPQGYARDYLYIDGAWRDHVLTARIDPAWRPA